MNAQTFPEDVLELQAHGGPVVLQLILARCLEAGRGIGLRLANPELSQLITNAIGDSFASTIIT